MKSRKNKSDTADIYFFQLQEDKIRAIQEKLELSEQKLEQFLKLPDMEEELKQRMEALTQVRDQVCGLKLFLFIICVEPGMQFFTISYYSTLLG